MDPVSQTLLDMQAAAPAGWAITMSVLACGLVGILRWSVIQSILTPKLQWDNWPTKIKWLVAGAAGMTCAALETYGTHGSWVMMPGKGIAYTLGAMGVRKVQKGIVESRTHATPYIAEPNLGARAHPED